MEDQTLILGYAEWIIIVGVTIGLFNYFSEKIKKLVPLAGVVIILTWIISTIIRGFKYIYLIESYELFTLRGFLLIMGEMLPILLLFGGITFAFKYVKFRKKVGSKEKI